MIIPLIQKDIINACAIETTKTIMRELDGDIFLVLLMSLRIFHIMNKSLFVCNLYKYIKRRV